MVKTKNSEKETQRKNLVKENAALPPLVPFQRRNA
jgi:hypothetical protein